MSAAALVHRLFDSPGGSAENAKEIQQRAAAAHAELLLRACAHADPELARSLTALVEFLRAPGHTRDKLRLLCDALFIEGLHGLAPFSADLEQWHNSVTAQAVPVPPGRAPPAGRASLGNVALVVLLRAHPRWQGELELCTDVLGRLGFPFSDWTLTLHTDQHDLLGTQAVTLSLDGEQAYWRLAAARDPPVLILSRADCLRMIVDNADPVDRGRLAFPHPRVKARLQCASALRRSPVRYDPVGFADFQAHAGVTGGLVESLLAAIRRNSPAVYREFRTFIQTVRGFEFPTSSLGVVGAFSDPTLPGVMSLNVPYTPDDEPRLDPCCFTWFGHELGHTKNYLIDTILYGEGVTLLGNAAQRTEMIPRYGRSLSLRTTFQVPYVHLYEWTLLMDFWEAGFRGLPWTVSADVAAVGEDLAAEISEAFALIDQCAELTPAGAAALTHFRDCFARTQERWRRLRSRRGFVASCP